MPLLSRLTILTAVVLASLCTEIGAQETVVAEPLGSAVDLREPPITTLGVYIEAARGEFPEDRTDSRHLPADANSLAVRAWSTIAKPWTPACTVHRPLYFEEVNAERYGYAYAPCLQPAVSTAHFFGTAVAMPYLMAAKPPCECVYTLGHYRPGDCPPYRAHGWPASCCGVGWQSAVVIGLIALVP